tara:strand:+ start:431 stop:1186 length:756 start_codon:yes stop_codon:yes gene_type:complete
MIPRRYNIFTVCNEEYALFLSAFLCSLYDNVDLENVERIYVVDFGIPPLKKQHYLDTFPLVEFVETQKTVGSQQVHDAGWATVTYSKVPHLQKICEKDNLPTLMVDVDSLFVGNIDTEIQQYGEEYDFVACRRNREGFSTHIGSYFMVLNPEKATTFLREWNNRTLLGAEKHKESPALSRLIQDTTEYKIFDEKESKMSNFTFDPYIPSEAYIVHLKSDAGLETIEKRLTQPKVAGYIHRYVNEINRCAAL